MNYIDPLENEIVRGKIRVAQEEFRTGKRSGSVRIEIAYGHGRANRVSVRRTHWQSAETEISRVSQIALDEPERRAAR